MIHACTACFSCPSITSINFSGCTITNDGIALLASQCKGLKSVTLESLRITDSGEDYLIGLLSFMACG